MNKKIIIFLTSLIIISLLCINVYATISGDISLSVSKTTSLSAGESFTVTLSLSELSGTTGIDSISGYINIDENILDDLTISSIVTNSSGQVEIDDNNVLNVYDASSVSSSSYSYGIVLNTNPTSGKGDYRLVIDLEEAISSGTDLITITFQVKSDAESGTYEDAITYSSFIIYEGTSNKYSMEDKSIDITVSASSSDDSNSSSDETITLEGISLNLTSTTLSLDSDDITLIVSPDPTDAELPDIVWTLSESGIVELTDNEDGTATISPVSSGSVTITATTEDGTYSATCTITISTSSDDDTSNSTNNSSSNNSSNNSSNSNTNSTTTNNSSSDDNTTASGSLPNAGFNLIILPILILTIAGIVFFKKYYKYKEIK